MDYLGPVGYAGAMRTRTWTAVRLDWDSTLSEYRPVGPPMGVHAPGPKAAAVRAGSWRCVHQGKSWIRVRVREVLDGLQVDDGPYLDYGVTMRVEVDSACRAL